MSNRKLSNKSFVSNSCESLFDIISSDFDIQHLENASIEEKRALRSFSRDFAAKYINFCSNEVIQGTFTVHRDFLVCSKVKNPFSLEFKPPRANCSTIQCFFKTFLMPGFIQLFHSKAILSSESCLAKGRLSLN